MKLINEKIDAIAFYGSSVRRDFDHLSDKDLLLISDDENALHNSKLLLSREGYSCACYTWNKLAVLAAKKALFIQHLKKESVIVADEHHRLHSLLASYSPAISYSHEIETTRQLVSLTENFPDTPKGIGWALDILAVTFRNFAILTLANEGKYIFSFSDILLELKKMGLISLQEQHTLSDLRIYKSHFRNRRFTFLPPKENVFELQQIIGKTFDASFISETVSEESFQYYCLHSQKALRTSHWYLQTRLCEGAYLTLTPFPTFRDSNMFPRFQMIEDAITNPSCYNFLLLDSANNLRGEMIDLTRLASLRVA